MNPEKKDCCNTIKEASYCDNSKCEMRLLIFGAVKDALTKNKNWRNKK